MHTKFEVSVIFSLKVIDINVTEQMKLHQINSIFKLELGIILKQFCSEFDYLAIQELWC